MVLEALSLLTLNIEESEERDKAMEDTVMKLTQGLARADEEIRKLKEIISRQEAAMSILKMNLQIQENVSFDGTLVWKIEDYKKTKSESAAGNPSSIYSNDFYTSKFGYRMCARVYLAGDGLGKGTHLSIFFAIKKGRYDDVLHWPFRQKVAFMLLDQNGQSNVVDSFYPDPKSTSFQKPTKEMNVASGCPKFVPLSTVENPHRGFVKGGKLYLKVTVDTDGLD